MAFQSFLEGVVTTFNRKIKVKPEFQDFLKEYDGRTVTIHIKDDASYIFNLSKNGITLNISQTNSSEDMYIETSKEVFQNMIEEKRVDPKDLFLGKIKWKNIGIKEVGRIKKILGIRSLNLKKEKLSH